MMTTIINEGVVFSCTVFFTIYVAICGRWMFLHYVSITGLIVKITISSLVISIGLKKAYFPLIRLPSCYRTVCYWIVCYWTVCYRTFQKANHIQRCSLKQPITFKVVITCACACACFCVFAFLFFVLLLYFNANFLLFHNLAIFLGNCNFMINW